MPISDWQRERQKKKAKMRWPTTRAGWMRRWKRTVEAIRDKATDLRDDREMYKTCLETISANPALDKRNEFFLLLEKMYVDHILVGLRTFDDTDLRSHSLYNLIEEILDHPRVITRAWFVGRYRRDFQEFGERDFSMHWGDGPYLGKRELRADLRTVKRACKEIRTPVNKWIAHTARRRPRVRLTYQQIDEALDTVYDLMKRYYLLICQSDWQGSALYPWTQVFDVPWKADAGESEG